MLNPTSVKIRDRTIFFFYTIVSNFLEINLYWITNSFQCFDYYNCYKTL